MNSIVNEIFGDEILKKINEGGYLCGDFKKIQPLELDYEKKGD